MQPHNILYKKKVLHLGDHFNRGNTLNSGFKTIMSLLSTTHSISGPAALMVVASKKRLSEFRKKYYSIYQHLFDICLCPPDLSNPSYRPDILWIDDINLLQSQIKNAEDQYLHFKDCHTIYSGKKDNNVKMKLIVDTREQKPLWKGKECKRMTMNSGDYTTEKLFDKFHIERKSLEDLYGSILKGHIRLRAEHLRAKSNDVQLSLYIEGTKKDFGAKKFKDAHRRKCSGQTLIKIIDSIEARWGLEVVWCGSRLKAKKMIYDRLQKEERRLT